MEKDQVKEPKKRLDKSKESGASAEKIALSAVPSEEEENPEEEKRILVSHVDETIEVARSGDSVVRQAKPKRKTAQISEEEVKMESPHILASRNIQKIERVIRPEKILRKKKEIAVQTLKGMKADRVDISSVRTVEPRHEMLEDENVKVSVAEELNLNRLSSQVEQSMSLEQRKTSAKPLEIEEKDPIFLWSGCPPYGSDRPKLILHKQIHDKNGESKIPSLQFLQTVLRDTYKEIEGGEPGGETVEFVANEPRIPQIRNNIVTLDLTGGGWKPSIRNGEPKIERSGIDIVPKLAETASTLFTGELGYFIVNIPKAWEHPFRRPDFCKKVAGRILNEKLSEEEDKETGGTLLEEARSSPVVIANPHTVSEEEFFKKVSRYFSLQPGSEKFTRVRQAEEIENKVLRKNDWKRIALVKRQETGEGESDEHYFWKASIAEGIAWKMKIAHDQMRNKEEKFEEFFKEKILSEGQDIISTEKPVEDENDQSKKRADISVNLSFGGKWVKEGVNAFAEVDRDLTGKIALEFETGRGEGAFNFRKIQETMEKYSEENFSYDFVFLIIPPHLLFKGKRRAVMILRLVKSWSELNNKDAGVFVPVLKNGLCSRLQPAKPLIESLYR